MHLFIYYRNVRFKEIIEMDQKTAWVQYYADIISSHDHVNFIKNIFYLYFSVENYYR